MNINYARAAYFVGLILFLYPYRASVSQPLFDTRIDYPVGATPWSVFSSDLDGDGTFQAAVNYPAGAGPQSVFSSDLDGDGDLDLAVANLFSDNVSIFKNNGDGTFQAAVYYGAGGYPFSVFSSDLDGDGDLDLAVANAWDDSVSIFKNNGDGTFQAAVNYEAGDGPVSIFSSDLDGDGDLDLAVANNLGSSVSILRNLLINCTAIAGDLNSDSRLNVVDIVYLVNIVLKSWTTPDPQCLADIDGDGATDLADVIRLAYYVFKFGFPAPVASGSCCRPPP